jgi:hypothetical protein
MAVKLAAPLVLWVFWFGPLGPVRRASIDKITKHAGVNVTLLTDSNYTRVGTLHPLALSPALSKNHLSDYLRAYVMHHYGRAYQDVKPTSINWREKLMRLNGDSDVHLASRACCCRTQSCKPRRLSA